MTSATFFIILSVASFALQGEAVSCPKKDGAYPVYIPHEDCTKFWECSNGKPYSFDCPANLHFNTELNVCDWPENAGCKGSADSGSDGSSEESDSSSSSSSSSSSEESAESLIIKAVPHRAARSIDDKKGVSCPAVDGEYPVYIPHKDCTKFWECSNGEPYLFDCPDNLDFNPELNVCDWPENAGCKGDTDSGSDDSTSKGSSEESGSSSSESTEHYKVHLIPNDPYQVHFVNIQ